MTHSVEVTRIQQCDAPIEGCLTCGALAELKPPCSDPRQQKEVCDTRIKLITPLIRKPQALSSRFARNFFSQTYSDSCFVARFNFRQSSRVLPTNSPHRPPKGSWPRKNIGN